MARRLVDNNSRREHRRQVALLDRLTVQFRARLQREIATAMKDMVEMWLQTNQVTLPRGFYDRIEATYRQMALASITQFGLRILDQGKSHGLPLETKESFAQIMTRLALRYVQQEMIRRRITEVTETTRRQIVNAVDRGYRDGLGQRGVADAILDLVPSLSATRANVIARTETHGAANYGSQEAAKQTGLPMKKEWIAAADERTRSIESDPPAEFGHAEADGDTVGMDEDFAIPMLDGGTEAIQYPGDPKGSAGNVINCRCTLGYIIDDEALEAML